AGGADGGARHAHAHAGPARQPDISRVVVDLAVTVVVLAVAHLGRRGAARAARPRHERRAVVDHAVTVVVDAVAGRLGGRTERRIFRAGRRRADLAEL